jgi:hypothetical protein
MLEVLHDVAAGEGIPGSARSANGNGRARKVRADAV